MIRPLMQKIQTDVATSELKMGEADSDSKTSKKKLQFKYKTVKDFNEKVTELVEDEYNYFTRSWESLTV